MVAYLALMKQLISLPGKTPEVDPTVWLAPTAMVIGEVTMGSQSTAWFHAVIRGDVAPITIGCKVNIQDGAVIHGTYGESETILEDNVSVGHNAIVHGAHVKEGALVGMGSVVMDHVVVGAHAVVAAGSVVLAHTQIGEGELWAGVPATCKGAVKPAMHKALSSTAERYVTYAEWFQESP